MTVNRRFQRLFSVSFQYHDQGSMNRLVLVETNFRFFYPGPLDWYNLVPGPTYSGPCIRVHETLIDIFYTRQKIRKVF